MKLKINKTGINGEGVGFYKRKPVFVDGALLNETVEVEFKEDFGKYYKAELKSIIVPSKDREEKKCKYQDKCGSCPLIISSYNHQLKVKRELLAESLKKYCGYSGKIADTNGSQKDFYYRNKLSLPFVDHNGKIGNGIFMSGSNIPVSIDTCMIHATKLEKVRKEICDVLNKNHCSLYNGKEKSGYRHLSLRGFKGHFQAIIVTGDNKMSPRVIADLKEINGLDSLYQGINTQKNPLTLVPEEIKLVFGERAIPFELGEYKFSLTPKAFFQLNEYTALNIYTALNKLVKKKVNTIVEAYSGIGAISMFLHDKADKIYGLEIEPSAVSDAKENAKLNNINNVEFICGDASKTLTELMSKEMIDILVVDPPRKGIDDDLLVSIKANKIPQILYVSCNPATLAKNIAILQDEYTVDKVIPYDMFPQTPHVEAIVVLTRK